MLYMTTKKDRVCRVCGKSFCGLGLDCGACVTRRHRAKHKCRLCGGNATYDGMVCRKCFWKTYKEVLSVLVERKVMREGEYKVEKPVLYG